MPPKPSLAERLRLDRKRSNRDQRAHAKLRKLSGTADLMGIVGIDMLTLKIGERTYEFDVRDELSIVNSDADKTLDSHAERMALWGNLAETVKHEIALAEIDLEDIRRNRYLAYRATIRDATRANNRAGNKPEKWTEREITALIDTDPDVVRARKTLAVKKQCLGYCHSMVRAFAQRGRMIVKWGKMTPHADDNMDS